MTLNEARQNARYTKRDVAKALEVTEQTIYKWEKGATVPNVKQFCKMCNLYGCAWSDIILP